jgi:hypothetical protein
VQDYLKTSRILGGIAVLVLIGGVLWDDLAPRFWSGHALIAGLASSVIVVMLTVAVVNEVLERRNRQRWSVLAQYVMLQLAGCARRVWMAVAEAGGFVPADAQKTNRMGDLMFRPDAIQAGAEAIHDSDRLVLALREVIEDEDRLAALREALEDVGAQNGEVLAHWAAVMLSAEIYAEMIDRHVELTDELDMVANLLDRSPDTTPPAGIKLDDDELTWTVAALAQLGERYERNTVQLAMRLVPIEWWTSRPGRAPAWRDEPWNSG